MVTNGAIVEYYCISNIQFFKLIVLVKYLNTQNFIWKKVNICVRCKSIFSKLIFKMA